MGYGAAIMELMEDASGGGFHEYKFTSIADIPAFSANYRWVGPDRTALRVSLSLAICLCRQRYQRR